jgi:hypothetical protein
MKFTRLALLALAALTVACSKLQVSNGLKRVPDGTDLNVFDHFFLGKDELSTKATPEERQQKSDEVAQKLLEHFPPQAEK